MPTITLPDGSSRVFEGPVSVLEIANDIGAGLGRATLAGEVDGQLVDAAFMVEQDCVLRIITDRDAEGLDIIRHSCAHLMAQAVKTMFPEAQVTIGPTIEDGFYYDFAYPQGFSETDLEAIENKMMDLAKMDQTITREVIQRDQAVERFEAMGESYKAEIVAQIPATDSISVYKQGSFQDLCRGPHVPSTGRIKAFKLTKLAGAYWRGNSDN